MPQIDNKKLICMKPHCRCMNIGKMCGNHHYIDSCFEQIDNKTKYEYLSHTHCWDNTKVDLPCGIPKEEHTQCCLCDMELPKTEKWREELSALEHEQWCDWSKSIVGSENISEERYKRWCKLWIPYSKLTEKEKESDRKYADKVLNFISQAIADHDKELIEKIEERQKTIRLEQFTVDEIKNIINKDNEKGK